MSNGLPQSTSSASVARLRIFSTWLCLILCILCTAASAIPAGDIAPRGNPDGQLNAADYLILQRIVIGAITPTPDEIRIADVAPLGAPDSQLNAGDLVVLMRAIQGQVLLPDVNLGPTPPTLNPISTTTNLNPFTITGNAADGLTVRLYVNDVLQASTMASAGTFSFEAPLSDGSNFIFATSWDGSGESSPSNVLVIDYTNEIPRTQDNAFIAQNTVWTPGALPSPYTISGTLEIADGASLTLMPGTELQRQADR